MVSDTAKTGTGVEPLNGILTNVVVELFLKYNVSTNEPTVVAETNIQRQMYHLQ